MALMSSTFQDSSRRQIFETTADDARDHCLLGFTLLHVQLPARRPCRISVWVLPSLLFSVFTVYSSRCSRRTVQTSNAVRPDRADNKFQHVMRKIHISRQETWQYRNLLNRKHCKSSFFVVLASGKK
jgi:hypothetical protein